MKTPEEKAMARKAYRKTEGGIAAYKRYRQSEKGKIARANGVKKYRQTERGKTTQKITIKRYADSEKGQATRTKIRDKYISMVQDHYGGKCICCGETEPLFLTVDHIDGGGTKHRKEINKSSMNRWIIENNYPDDLQLLCWNCNCGRARNNGVCPHVKTKST